MSKWVFMIDSGVGGLFVLAAARAALPQTDFWYIADHAYAPYGEKSEKAVTARLHGLLDSVAEDCKAAVFACNTATACAVDSLRQQFKFPIVGLEPALRPARQAAAHLPVLVLATRATVRLPRYARLMADVGGTFISRGCPELVQMVENEALAEISYYIKEIKEEIAQPVGAVVLGCTHFCFARPQIQAVFPDTPVFDGNAGAVAQLQRILGEKPEGEGLLHMESTGNTGQNHALQIFFSKIQ